MEQIIYEDNFSKGRYYTNKYGKKFGKWIKYDKNNKILMKYFYLKNQKNGSMISNNICSNMNFNAYMLIINI